MDREFILKTELGFNAYDFIAEFKKLQFKGHFKNITSITSLNFEKESENTKDQFLLREAYGIK